MSPTLVHSRWRMDGWVLRPRLSPPPNICKPLLVSPPPLPPGCYNQCAIHRGVRRNHRRRKRKIRNGRTDVVAKRKRFFIDAIFNEHRHRSRCAHSRRKQAVKERGLHEHREIPSRVFRSRPPLLRGFVSVSLFSVHSRMENENVSLPSAMNRARAMFSVLSPLVQLFLALFLSISLYISLSYISYLLTFAQSPSLAISRSSSLPSIHGPVHYIVRVFLAN